MAVTSMPPDQIAQRWSSGLSGATTRMQAGAESVRVSPGQLAARQAQVWLANTQAALAKFQSRSAAVSLPQWQNAFITKGLPRVAAGATAAEPKVAAFMTTFIPFLQQGVNSLPARGTLDQNIARSAAMIRFTSKFPGYQKPA